MTNDFTFKEPKPTKNYVTTRMPDNLRAKIQVVADKERRSLSSQIVFMLEQQIEQHENSNP
jgi:hypothetical protein